jgi:FdhD protein
MAVDTTTRRVTRVEGGRSSTESDHLVVEAPVEFRLDRVPIAVLMRTPGDDVSLALGFCLTEGIILAPAEFEGLAPEGEGDRYRIVLSPGVEIDPERFRRNTYTTSSCGVCGKASIDAVRVAVRGVPSAGPFLSTAVIGALPARLRARQPAFDATGAIHAAAIFDADASIESVAEDVGRHNAVDKAIGELSRRRWPLGSAVLCVSGRISFEIVQKAAVAGIPIVVGVSAASSLAVDLAEDMGMTLVGFARGSSMVVYTDPGRITE